MPSPRPRPRRSVVIAESPAASREIARDEAGDVAYAAEALAQWLGKPMGLVLGEADGPDGAECDADVARAIARLSDLYDLSLAEISAAIADAARAFGPRATCAEIARRALGARDRRDWVLIGLLLLLDLGSFLRYKHCRTACRAPRGRDADAVRRACEDAAATLRRALGGATAAEFRRFDGFLQFVSGSELCTFLPAPPAPAPRSATKRS